MDEHEVLVRWPRRRGGYTASLNVAPPLAIDNASDRRTTYTEISGNRRRPMDSMSRDVPATNLSHLIFRQNRVGVRFAMNVTALSDRIFGIILDGSLKQMAGVHTTTVVAVVAHEVTRPRPVVKKPRDMSGVHHAPVLPARSHLSIATIVLRAKPFPAFIRAGLGYLAPKPICQRRSWERRPVSALPRTKTPPAGMARLNTKGGAACIALDECWGRLGVRHADDLLLGRWGGATPAGMSSTAPAFACPNYTSFAGITGRMAA